MVSLDLGLGLAQGLVLGVLNATGFVRRRVGAGDFGFNMFSFGCGAVLALWLRSLGSPKP